MEAQKPTVGKFAMNYGVILGVIMIFIGVITYVTGMALEGTQWPQWLYYIIFPIVIFYAISQFKKQNANVLSLGEAIKLGVVIAAISAIIYVIYGLIFNYIIDPEFMGIMKEVVRDKMLEAPNATQEMVDQQMKVVEMFMNPLIGSALWIALSMFFGLIYSLIGGLVMKKE
jgi:cation transport ATPase